MVKVYFKVGLITTGVFALFSFLISLTLAQSLFRTVPSVDDSGKYKYHLALYLPQNRNSFFAQMIEGAQRGAAESGAVLSVHTIDREGSVLNMASYIGVDGVIVCPTNDDELTLMRLERLRKETIPLILVNHNIPAEQPWPFIGTNNYDFGKKAASLVSATGDGDILLSVVYSEKTPAIYAERELVEMGMNSVLSRRMSAPIYAQRTDLNPRDAEKIIYQILHARPSINTIVFTDTSDTLAGTQALIDLNLVGRIQVIGFGADPAIFNYIQKGIISASILVNPEHIGNQAVKSLVELLKSGYTSTSVDTGIDIVSKSNVESYLLAGEEP